MWPLVRAWLDAAPDRTAKEVLLQLQKAHPNTFPDGQLRTLQRRVRGWRAAAAKKLVFGPGLGDRQSMVGAAEINAVAAGLSGAIWMRQAGNMPS